MTDDVKLAAIELLKARFEAFSAAMITWALEHGDSALLAHIQASWPDNNDLGEAALKRQGQQ